MTALLAAALSRGQVRRPNWARRPSCSRQLRAGSEVSQGPVRQNWNDRWRVQGSRNGVDIVAIVASDGLVWTAWPREGCPGVVKNKPEDR